METEEAVRADANPACRVCEGRGWHWGWHRMTRAPLMLRCPCVDQNRSLRATSPPSPLLNRKTTP